MATTYDAWLTVTYLDAGTVVVESSIGGQVLSNRQDIASLRTTFDTIGIGIGQAIGTFTVDNIELQLIPEPTSLLLLALGAPLLHRRRRG